MKHSRKHTKEVRQFILENRDRKYTDKQYTYFLLDNESERDLTVGVMRWPWGEIIK